jgi:1,4-dihydroxy-2-naphthoate octaprenyltransferase
VTLKEWWALARPPTLPASVVPVAVGTAAGGIGQPWGALPVMLAVALLLQIATNMTNEYADYRRGIDHPASAGIAGVIVSGRMSADTIRTWALATYGMALALGLVLVAIRGPVLLGLGVFAILAGFLYNAGPRPVSATPFGEVLVFFVMGPLEVLVSEVAVAGRVTATAGWASVTVGLMVAAILLANNLRDRESDRERGRRTLPVRLGPARGLTLLLALVTAALVWPVVAALLRLVPPAAGAVVLLLPWAWRTVRRLHDPAVLRRAVLLVGRIHLVAGLVLALGLALG